MRAQLAFKEWKRVYGRGAEVWQDRYGFIYSLPRAYERERGRHHERADG
jgi:hypothetical protein